MYNYMYNAAKHYICNDFFCALALLSPQYKLKTKPTLWFCSYSVLQEGQYTKPQEFMYLAS